MIHLLHSLNITIEQYALWKQQNTQLGKMMDWWKREEQYTYLQTTQITFKSEKLI